MGKRHLFASFVTGLLLSPAPVVAQSLADVARAEEARRKALKTPVKVYTNEDLGTGRESAGPPPAADPSTAKPAGSATAGAAKPALAPKAAEPSDAAVGGDEKYWRTRISEARTALQRSQAFYDALQSQMNGLYTQFVAVDDPAQRALIEQKRLGALAEQERVKAELTRHTKAISAIEDEARRASVPPGWLR